MWVRIRYMHGGVDAFFFLFCFRRDHDSGGGCSRGYGSTSIRTTPLSSRHVSPFSASSSTFVAVAAKSSSAPTGIAPLLASRVVPVNSDSVILMAAAGLLMPIPVDQFVVAPGTCVPVRNLKEDQRWPSPSGFASRTLVPVRLRMDAVATTGKLATVSDMQSSTSAEMMTGMPPVVMMYEACTRDTMVVTTAETEVSVRTLARRRASYLRWKR